MVGQESSIYGTLYNGDTPTFYNPVSSVSNSFEIVDQSSFGVYTGSDGFTSIDNAENKAIKLYPNPTTGWIYLEFEQLLKEKTVIELFNQQGNIVDYNLDYENQKSTQELVRFNFGDLSPGLYLLRFTTNKKQIYKKFVLE